MELILLLTAGILAAYAVSRSLIKAAKEGQCAACNAPCYKKNCENR